MLTNQEHIFSEKIDTSVENGEFIKLIISNKRHKTSELNKIIISPVEIKKGFRLSFLYNYKTQDITKNYELEESQSLIFNELKENFLNAELFTANEIIRLFFFAKNNKPKIKISEPTFKPVVNLNHDRKKHKRVELKNNIWLKELGITTSEDVIKKDMHDKFRQINKYLEVIENMILKKSSGKNLRIYDAGSGKGYLTFALYDYLKNNLKIEAHITGIEFRQELVDKCNKISGKAKFGNLNFVQGTIIDSKINEVDVFIALHACDTATDEAIYKGIKANAQFIVAAPCCQKQIRKQMNVTNAMTSLTKHGILKERQAVILTDGLRALILEANGYKTKVFEFISTEHTPKNIMIVAEKTNKKFNKDEINKNINEIKQMFGIENHYLEKLLNEQRFQI
ncbi:MAG: SAM-dependent methyltransferase [Bacteroidales bacterium]|nr:SAM-dependent methyltransferase [Bacteroidales bacterium]